MRNLFRKIFPKKGSTANSPQLSINSVVPLIKSKEWIDSYQLAIRTTLENVNQPLSRLNELGIVNQLFLPDLYLVYAYNFSDSLAYLSLPAMKNSGVNQDMVHTIAISNASNLNFQISPLSKEVFLIQTDDLSLTTAMVFRDNFWDKEISAIINDDPIISINSRDAILIGKRNSASSVKETKEFAKAFVSVDEKSLSTELFVRSDEKWVLFFGLNEVSTLFHILP